MADYGVTGAFLVLAGAVGFFSARILGKLDTIIDEIRKLNAKK
jgi:hypothetical protein